MDQFLCALGICFWVDKSIPKSAITELYKNLLYETLSGARDFNFQAVSDLVSEVSFISLRKNWQRTYLFKPLAHKKTEHSYVEPQVQDTETIEIETKKEDDDFFDLEQKFNATDNAATEQKKTK